MGAHTLRQHFGRHTVHERLEYLGVVDIVRRKKELAVTACRLGQRGGHQSQRQMKGGAGGDAWRILRHAKLLNAENCESHEEPKNAGRGPGDALIGSRPIQKLRVEAHHPRAPSDTGGRVS